MVSRGIAISFSPPSSASCLKQEAEDGGLDLTCPIATVFLIDKN